MELFEACSSFPKYDPYPPNCFPLFGWIVEYVIYAKDL